MTRIKDLPTFETLDSENWVAVDTNSEETESGKASVEVLSSYLSANLPFVQSVNQSTGISVNNSDPNNPLVGLSQSSQDALNLATTAVQPHILGGLAYQDQITVPDIDATGTPNSSSALFGDGVWKEIPGGGNMLSSIYDPQGIGDDAFLRQNHIGFIPGEIPTYEDMPEINENTPPIFGVELEPGIAKYTHDGSTATMVGWLGKVEFPTVSALKAFTGSLGPVGTRIRAGGFDYDVVDDGESWETDGGVKVNALPTVASSLVVTAFGMRQGISYDDTIGIARNTDAFQRCINAAALLGIYTITIPEGHFLYGQVYFFHHTTLNPGFPQTPNRHGRFRLVGGGDMAVVNLRLYTDTSVKYGSVLEATGDSIVVARQSLGHNTNPFPARKFEAEGITFVGNKSGQFVIEAAGCPFFSTNRVSIYQRHPDGHGALVKSAWFQDYEHTTCIGQTSGTGTGFSLGTAIFAGLCTFRNGHVDTWAKNVDWQEGEFTNIQIENTAFQNGIDDHLLISGGIVQQLTLRNVYFESGDNGARKRDIRSVGTSLRQIKIEQLFYLGGVPGGNTSVEERSIDIGTIDSVDINGVYGFRGTKPFMRVGALRNSGRVSGKVSNFIHTIDFTYSGDPVFLFEGVLPDFGTGIVWPGYENGYRGTNLIKLFDTDAGYPTELDDRRTGIKSINSLALGQRRVYTDVTSTISINALTRGTVFEATVTAGGGVSMTLPTNSYMPDGRVFMVKNNAASAGILVLRNADFSSIKTLQPGQSVIAVFDGATEKYVAYLETSAPPEQQDAISNDASGAANQATVNAILDALRDYGVIAS